MHEILRQLNIIWSCMEAVHRNSVKWVHTGNKPFNCSQCSESSFMWNQMSYLCAFVQKTHLTEFLITHWAVEWFLIRRDRIVGLQSSWCGQCLITLWAAVWILICVDSGIDGLVWLQATPLSWKYLTETHWPIEIWCIRLNLRHCLGDWWPRCKETGSKPTFQGIYSLSRCYL